MGDTNYYSYLYGQSEVVAFDELAEAVDLTSPSSIQKAFEAYLTDNNPPMDIREALLEEKFYSSDGEGRNGDEVLIRYDMSVPGMEEGADTALLKQYFDDFLERIGAENDASNSAIVEIDEISNERGGMDINIYIAIGGEQIKQRKEEK